MLWAQSLGTSTGNGRREVEAAVPLPELSGSAGDGGRSGTRGSDTGLWRVMPKSCRVAVRGKMPQIAPISQLAVTWISRFETPHVPLIDARP